MRRARGIWLSVLAGFLITATPALADMSRTDVQVAARALSFVSNPLTGAVNVGILYSADSSRSVRQAEALRQLLAGGFRIGAVELSPVLVEAGEAASADVDLYFLTEHIPAGRVPKLTDGSGAAALCITIDLEQVRNGACTIGVRSRPKVEVFVNNAAAKASDVSFSTVFRVMITEL